MAIKMGPAKTDSIAKTKSVSNSHPVQDREKIVGTVVTVISEDVLRRIPIVNRTLAEQTIFEILRRKY